MYVTPLVELTRGHGFSLVLYADDTQLVISISSNADTIAGKFHGCLKHIVDRMHQNYLKLNTGKTEVMEFGTGAPHWNHEWWPAEAGQCPVPTGKVRNLRILLNDQIVSQAKLISLHQPASFN